MNKNFTHTFKYILLIIIPIILIVSIVATALNFTAIKDWFKTIGYSYPPKIAALDQKLGLTGEASIIFKASYPTLDNREDFNKHCDSHTVEISVLGCYTREQIYLYDVDSAELTGLVESTAAHELLHAVWDRLPASERDYISVYLQQVYNKNQETLAQDLSIYSDEDRLDELHSRVGTEIANLPDELESHYARYFINQDKIVSYYTSYITPFKRLSKELEQLSQEMDTLKAKIDQESSEYATRAEALSGQITEFNECARTTGCFSPSSFSSRRRELLDEQDSLSSLYDQLESDIAAYNEKVVVYNKNVLRTTELQNSINSNSTPPTI